MNIKTREKITMRKLLNKLRRGANNLAIGAKCAIQTRKAEGYVDTGVKILIAVVLGALVLTLLYALLNGTVMPKVTEKVNSMFAYTA
mgnify:FL=1